ncbi:phage portal protein [Bradyrhizobium sp. S3.7.6]
MSNVLDRIIGYVSPERGAARARARTAIRLYEGADRGRRAGGWVASGTSANSELQGAISPLRDRSRDLARNNPWAHRMLDILCSHSVGNGIIPVSNTGSDKLDNQVNALWEEFCEQSDITGCMNFYAMQDLAVRSMAESGEIVLRFIDREMTDREAVPLKLQLLEADFIDQDREGLFAVGRENAAPGVERNRLGVGLGKFDEWRGLWLWPRHPGEMNDTLDLKSYTSQFVSRDDLVHMFRRERPGQVRGVPWFAPILMTARDLSDILDAANVKARVEACFAGFITNSDESMPLLEDNGNVSALQNAMTTTLEPGMLKELRSGQDIKFAAPTSTSQLETILINNLQAMAAGVGCTYDQATGDLRQANYSSLRAGKIEFWRLIGKLQQHVIIPQLCKPVWYRFINRAVLAGRLTERTHRGGYPARWVVPAKEMIDPKKDFDATKNLVRSGAMTPQDFIASFGGDWRHSIDEFKKFFEVAHKAEVVLDIDVARVDQHGRQPAKPGEDGAALEQGDAALDDVEKPDSKDDDDDDQDEAA